MMDSELPGFFAKSPEERLDMIASGAGLTPGERDALEGGITRMDADRMVENAIGVFSLPLGVATNFRVNGKDYLVPMSIEEPSVIAAASRSAKSARAHGGFTAEAGEPYSIGQIQVVGATPGAAERVLAASNDILDMANSKSKTLPAMGRGAKSVSCRDVAAPAGKMLIVEILVNVGDAMGANVTNTMCEAVAPLVQKASGGRVLLRILSNYSTSRMVRASAVFDTGGVDAGDMLLAYEFADWDVYRAVTHNKGIMNGVVAVANATGQDVRAIEAAAHAYAAASGRYRSLSRWEIDGNGNLTGTLEMPLAVGTVGGVANVHPTARACSKILGAASSKELAGIMAAVGLAQNFGALRALAGDGIQKGHMRLHARNVAVAAGATPKEADRIAGIMISEGSVSAGRARELLESPHN